MKENLKIMKLMEEEYLDGKQIGIGKGYFESGNLGVIDEHLTERNIIKDVSQ